MIGSFCMSCGTSFLCKQSHGIPIKSKLFIIRLWYWYSNEFGFGSYRIRMRNFAHLLTHAYIHVKMLHVSLKYHTYRGLEYLLLESYLSFNSRTKNSLMLSAKNSSCTLLFSSCI